MPRQLPHFSLAHALKIWGLVGILMAIPGPDAFGARLLPYTYRTHCYSGWSTTIRGDIRTLGMAGATVGLADSFIAAGENPAGLAMNLQSFNIKVTGNRVHDAHVQDRLHVMSNNNFGITESYYPWGFSLGYWVPQSEGQIYQIAEDGEPFTAEVLTREFRASVARLFFDNRLALGGSATLGQAAKYLEFETSASRNVSHHAYGLGGNLGLMYRSPRRVMLGLTYHFPMTIHANGIENLSPVIENFFRPLKTPTRIGLGLGWIPNRVFRLGLSLYWIGSTSDVALLSDDEVMVGQKPTLQPRLGLTYTAAELKELTINLSLGSYYEISRIEGKDNRLHTTAGLEANPWILNLGWGIDYADGYVNYIASVGVDVIRIMQKMDIIPRPSRPPNAGYLPKPTFFSDQGLPRPYVEHWTEEQKQGTDLVEIGLKAPRKLEDRVLQAGDDFHKLSEEFLHSIGILPTPTGQEKEKTRKQPLELIPGYLDKFQKQIHQDLQP